MKQDMRVIHLKAGEMHYSVRPSLVVTVLGSCLSVTMHAPRLGIGGICHSLLPLCEDRRRCTGGCAEGFRYVDCSIRRMIRLFDKAGAARSELEVKCFGGADLFSRPIEKPNLLSIGRQNAATAEKILKHEGLRIRKKDVGGLHGRKIYFYSHTGEVLLRRLTRTGDPGSESIRSGEVLTHG